MKRLLLLALLLISINTFAQVNTVPKRINAKLGFSLSDPEDTDNNLPNFRVEVNYKVVPFLEVGVYGGFGFYQAIQREIVGSGISATISGYAASNYGLNANFHILPLVVKERKLRFDLYVSGKLGTINPEKTDASPLPDKFLSDYGVYAGAAYYLTRHFGVYGEFGYGSYTTIRYGLSFKF
ncbi:MAG: outer membrane beta-barrel protein [Bacteroidales bacterium]|nr:outer membrane beta-barrel protein [Bacteroidales bacterium]